MTTRILYVDDEPDIREIAQMALELDPQLEVRTAASGREGLAEAESWQPDLILLDVMMPELDGPSVLERLRQHEATTAIPVVFITARAQSHEIEHFQSLGALGVIAKPFDPMSLADQAKSFLNG